MALEGDESHIHRMGVLSGIKKAVLVSLRVFSLKKFTVQWELLQNLLGS